MKSYSKYLFIPLLAFLLIPMSCADSDLLNQENGNTVAEGSFWKSPDDVRLAVNGMYHPITNTFFWGRIVHTGAMLRSDVFNVRPFGPNTAMSHFAGEPGAARWAIEIWQEPFVAIFRANSIIANTNADNVPDQATRDGFVGQAHFMRAFCYWYLVNLFGNVPLVTEAITGAPEDNFFPAQATPEQVYSQIIADLTTAEGMLPETWTGSDIGRPTKWSATALKGKSYLYQGQWADAETALQQVVSSGRYELLPSSQYGDNFTEANENNVESVYELQFLGQESFAWGVDIPNVGNMGNFHIDYAPPTKSPDQSHYVNKWVRELFEANGETVRRDQTIAYDYPGSTGYGGVDFRTDFAGDLALARAEIAGDPAAGVDPIPQIDSVFTRKYAGMDIGTRDEVDFLGTNVGNNWRIIRYSDVLLMLAEAKNELNKVSDAEGLVNQVRDRAMVDPISGLGQDAMRQAIIDERVLELTGEGHRFFDLVRWGLADDYMGPNSLHGESPKSASKGVFQEGKHEYIWIPASEISANGNLKQNPGY